MTIKCVSEINEYVGTSINPMEFPNQMYELYSVPSFESGYPEIIAGSDIGSSKITVEEGDILICKINPRINRVWVVHHYSEFPLLASSEWIVVRNRNMNPYYLKWYFSSPNFRSLLSSQVTGIGGSLTRAQPKQVAKYPVPVPTREEQDYIAEVLEHVNVLISKQDVQLHKMEELVKSRFIEMFGDPVRNEKNWPLVQLGDVAEIRIGPFGTLIHKEDYVVDGHALVNPSHILDGNIQTDEKLTISDEKYNELSAYHLFVDDIVLGRRGEMGRCAVVNRDGLLCGTGSMILRPNKKIKPYFLQNIISSPAYKKIIEEKAVGVTMMNLNVPIVSSLVIPLFPIDMQGQFIEFMQATDKSKLLIEQCLKKLNLLKKSLIQDLFD